MWTGEEIAGSIGCVGSMCERDDDTRTSVGLAALVMAQAVLVLAETNAPQIATTAPTHGMQEFGGKASVSAQLKADEEPQEPAVALPTLEQYEPSLSRQRSSLRDSIGLTLGGDYNELIQAATQSLGDDWAAGGAFRVYGNWAWPGKPWENPGALSFKFENRHGQTDTAPQQLGGEIGYTGLTADTWSDRGWLLTNLYWHQQFFENRVAVIAGVVDVTDYVDVYGMVNPWTDYINSVFLTNPTLAAPGQGLGIAAYWRMTTNLYVLGGFANANGDPSKPAEDFDTFFTEGEYFKHFEVGWISSWEQRYRDNIHLTLWQTSERSDSDVPSGWGGAVSASHMFAERWLPFIRAGLSDGGGGVPLEAAAAVGIGYYLRDQQDLLALGLNWGRPSSETFGDDLHDEYTVEMLYRVMLLKHLALTPDVQLIINPALNPDQDFIAVFGLRARVNF